MNEHRTPDPVPSYLGVPLAELLVALAEPGPVPGGGSAAVIAVTLAAALCTMAARLSVRQVAQAQEIAAEAASIGAEVAPLCDEDPRSYMRVIAASRVPGPAAPDPAAPDPAAPDPAGRARRIADAQSEAAEVPMAVVRAGARLVRLAARLAEEGNPSLRGDAVVAALLAGAGAESAAALVRINLAALPRDARHAQVRELLEESGTWVERARGSVPS